MVKDLRKSGKKINDKKKIIKLTRENVISEDGTYVNTYTDAASGTQVTEYFNSGAPNKIETIYDYGTTEIEYLNDSGVDAKDHIYEDGSVYKSFLLTTSWMF